MRHYKPSLWDRWQAKLDAFDELYEDHPFQWAGIVLSILLALAVVAYLTK